VIVLRWKNKLSLIFFVMNFIGLARNIAPDFLIRL